MTKVKFHGIIDSYKRGIFPKMTMEVIIMQIDELRSRIAQANAKSSALNNERQVLIGKKESLTAQLEKGIADYNARFNRNITKDDIQAELEKVVDEKARELERLDAVLGCIAEGNFEEAEHLSKVPLYADKKAEETVHQAEDGQYAMNVTQQAPVQQPQAAPVQQQAPVQQPQAAPVQQQAPVQQPNVAAPNYNAAPQQPQAPFVQMPKTAPAPTPAPAPVPTPAPAPAQAAPAQPKPAAPFMNEPEGMPQAPKPPVGFGGMFGGALSGFQPAGAQQKPDNKPKASTVPTDFSQILGGSVFGGGL